MSWDPQVLLESTYLRCVSFSSREVGWLGALSGPDRLYRTSNGGQTWEPVQNLPADGPRRICGLHAVSDEVVFASGTNYPNERAGVLRSRDGGASWEMLNLDDLPALLVDIFFEDALSGWVVGGVDEVKHPDRETERRDVVPAVFYTADGGETWVNQVELNAQLGELPRGEWGWKIQKVGASTLFVSCENFLDGAILRSDDRGGAWRRLLVNDRQRNSNLEGVGFLDANTGWVGGWGDRNFQGGFTSATTDGGHNWSDANDVGFRLNRFRFVGDPVRVAYASGDTVYKFGDEPVPQMVHPAAAIPDLDGADSVSIDFDVPPASRRLTIRIWERFGREVRVLLEETGPTEGPRAVAWDFTDDSGVRLPPGGFIIRIVIDGASMSWIAHRRS